MRLRLCLLFAFCFVTIYQLATSAADFERWEKDIQKFEARDKESPPPKHGVLFIGSSSIRNWDLEKSFPGEHYINRGFGGSQIVDSTHFSDRIVFPYKPRVIVLYAGDNDVNSGKPPKQVFDDFNMFAKTVHEKLPKARMVFIAIKPSIKRWNLVEKMREANRLIDGACRQDSRLVFVDIDNPSLGKDGKPREELFVEDGLHLSAAGYKLWTSLVAPHLDFPK